MQFGYVMRPTHRSREYEKDRFEVCNHRYSALCDASHGAAVLNDCKYGISMNQNALELTLLRAAAAPEMRADNQVHHFTYAFTAWEGDFAGCDVVKQGYELNEKPRLVPGCVPTIIMVFVNIATIIVQSGLGSALIQKKFLSEEDYSLFFYINYLFLLLYCK